MSTIVPIYYKHQKKLKSERTKNKSKKSAHTTNPMESLLNLVDSQVIQSYNNERYITDLVKQGLDKYEIHERVMRRFKVNLGFEYIESFL